MLGYDVHAFSEPLYCPIYHVGECECNNHTLCADIIITDINMPRISGLEFLKKKKENGCKAPHVAIMSATWTNEEQQEALASGYKIFEKPFELLEIKKWLDECEKDDTSLQPRESNNSPIVVFSENMNIKELPCSLKIHSS